MSKWVSPSEKRYFLKWFLECQQLKRTDARKVIEYIINHYHILENVSFTEKMMLNRKTIVISSMNTDEPGFAYYHNQRKTDEIAMALGDLMMNPTEKVFMILNFNGKTLNHRYLQLIESPALENMKQYNRFQKYEQEVNEIIEKNSLEMEIAIIKNQIDRALDQKDEKLFKRLTEKLKELIAKG
ncbi:YpiB family protein [Bacillus sp. BRMEA1]|uniref:YpiB family protein n=1 Tax=Neobacillus endophyticus TaxID=2738405 RepID=UPI001566BADA|nr:YpiB family protein [Neobacillus endophyticus]NRD78945.1 YpiB family protein [Neobacillus endophyticus]